MTRTSGCLLCCASLIGTLLTLTSPSARAQWTPPTPEELSMTAQPEVPGAAAVYLFREETTDDHLHTLTIYTRLKVLNERGKEFSDVELPNSTAEHSRIVENIEGRTIHSDGTIILFTGKPYEKLNQKAQGGKSLVRVFTLPDVEVGSIIEYRYKLRSDESTLFLPQWFIQSNLWTRKGHYLWKPIDGSTRAADAHGQRVNSIFWTSILPSGVEVSQSSHSVGEAPNSFELNVQNIPPSPSEPFMPPLSSFTYRVFFYYSAYKSGDEFWKDEGKYWAKTHDKFIGPGSGVSTAVQKLTSPSDTQDQKLRKIYDTVMQLENTSFTRKFSTPEERVREAKAVRTTDDVLTSKRGSNVELTELFVAMARAAGMKAYFASVTNRNRNIFSKAYLSLSQLDGYLAIVNVDGKEMFFDPGALYCPYGHLVWQQTQASGIRQTEGGADLFQTPPESYSYSHTQRVANLDIDQQDNVTGTIKMTYIGYPNLGWRQSMITGDITSMKQALSSSVERLVPRGMEVKLSSIDKLEDYEQPLVVIFEVSGHLGLSTGKRLLIPGDLFEANSTPKFLNEKREIPVSFSYPNIVQDAIRITFPTNFSIESLPANDSTKFRTSAGYDMTMTSTATSIVARRNFTLGEILYPSKDYPELRSFYSKMETKDQESVVLTTAPVTASKTVPTGN
jgi:hypothetical protein